MKRNVILTCDQKPTRIRLIYRLKHHKFVTMLRFPVWGSDANKYLGAS